jgi:ABC-type uncharacterized transport system YnjBCD ATPase subunit
MSMTTAATLNTKQARAIAELIEGEFNADDDNVVHVENEFTVGGGTLLKVSGPSPTGRSTGRIWLVGRDGGVIEL